MFPSFRRSSNGRPRLRYSEAIFTTKDRFDSTSSLKAPAWSLLLKQAASLCSSSRVRMGNSPMSDKYLETELLLSCCLYSINSPSRRPPVRGRGWNRLDQADGPGKFALTKHSDRPKLTSNF